MFWRLKLGEDIILVSYKKKLGQPKRSSPTLDLLPFTEQNVDIKSANVPVVTHTHTAITISVLP